MASNYVEQLKRLKEKLDFQSMSVMIGAGFSKNVSDIFPSWWELLFDMTYFLFENVIEQSYQDANSRIKNKSKVDKKAFINMKVEQYISEIGYLDMVSMYIKRKGYREAIDTYIEEKTPKVIEIDNSKYLVNTISGKENKILLKKEMFSLHKSLLQLPWNNIYTTNYDEMLELANDSTTYNSIEKAINEIEKEIVELTQKIVSTQEQIEKINIEVEKLKNGNILSIGFENEIDTPKNQTKVNLDNSNNVDYRVINLKYTLYGLQKTLEEKENSLPQLRKAKTECLEVVIDSTQLRLKRNKNIIKLHGTLRKEKDRYGFDGDIRKHYVIAKEDFDTYPVKHEAFTQLMRISLLQESYCLIGFSGVDTNFIEWIKWVRDVIERKGSDKNADEYKIYLIDLSLDEIPSDKLLFLENHNVCRIPLCKDELIDFLEQKVEITISDRNSKKNILELFLKFLSSGLTFNSPRSIFENIQQNKYDKLWETINIPFPIVGNEKFDVNDILKNINAILELKKYRRLAPTSFYYTHRKRSLISFSMALLEELDENTKKIELLNLIYTAVNDCCLFLNTLIWNEDTFRIISDISFNNKKLTNEFNILQLRQYCIEQKKEEFKITLNKIHVENKTEIIDKIEYEKILFSAFSLDFKKLNQQLNKWNPSSTWVLKKAGLMALFNVEYAIDILKLHYSNYNEETHQEQLHTLFLIRYLKQSKSFERDYELQSKIKLYQNAGLKDISDLLDYIFDDLKEKDKKIIPYEEGRYTISNGFKLSNDFNDPQKGIQVIQTLLECGYPICLGSVYLKDKEKWYTVFKLIYNYYPFPVLFFSLQYSDENLIKRMGQDFAFSDGLKDDIIQILPMLLKAFLTPQTPQNIRKSILNFSSELFISLEPKYWESLFYRIWKKNEFIKKAYAKRPCEEQNFVEKAIPFIKSKVIIEDIINNSLKHIDSNISTNYLNQIARNKKLEKELKINQSLTLANNIHKLILSLSISENAWFILGNIDSIISKSQIKLIQKQIFKLNLNNLKDERIWHVLLYYSKNNKILVDLIKKSIITNKSLWNSGFTQDGLSSGYFHIKLSTLVKNKNHQNGIIWTKSEVIEIFKRLVIEILKIENWLKKDRGSNKNFSFILEEMMFFLNAEKTKIKEISESSSIIKKVYDLYLDSKGYKNLVDGILSKENTKVIWALSELSNKIYISNWLKDSDIKQEVDALLNKILLQSEPSLEASISYLAAFVRDKSNMELFQPKSTILVMILKKYLENPLEEFDKPFVYEKLIIIANNLKKWHFRSVYIDKWLSIQQNTHFNNIKFNINV